MRVASLSFHIVPIVVAAVAMAAPSGASAITQAECTPVRMDQGNGSVARMPIHNQQDAGVCFAYTATQLVDAWRFKHRRNRDFLPGTDPSLPHLSSPVPVYFGIARDERRLAEYESGIAGVAVEFLREHGSCSSEGIFSSTHLSLTAAEARLRRELMETFDEYMELITRRPDATRPWETVFTQEMRRLQRAHPGWSSSRHALEAKYNLARPLANELCRTLEGLGLPLPTSAVNAAIDSHRVIAALMASSVDSLDLDTGFAGRYLANVCRGHVENLADLPPLVEKDYSANGSQATQLERDLHARLSRPNPLPVVADFCTNVLTMPEPYRGMWRRQDGTVMCRPDPDAPEDNGKSRHSILVIGRRWNAERNTCQILLRNSWGEHCKPEYSSRAPWSCGGPGETDGQIWIDSDDFAANAYRLTYLEE